jgi:PadR family transcriptional regulator, regulatory protein PadR
MNHKDLLGASAAIMVLGVLAPEPSYGYDILRKINSVAGDLFVWQEGTLYPVLHKLEKSKLLRAQWQESDAGRQRKYYYITAAGRTALRKDIEEWTAVNQLILKIAGANHG